VVGLPAMTGLLRAGPSLSLTNDILVFLAAVVGVSLIGGLWPALLAAVAGSLLLNYFFTPPLGRFTIAEVDNLLALAIFVVIAIAVSWVVDTAARKTRQAAEAGADAQTLATVAGGVLRGERPLMALLERLRETFVLDSVTLLDAGVVAAHVGEACTVARDADVEVKVDDGPWQAATIDKATSDKYSWKLFNYTWTGATPGEHTLVSRVTDVTGLVQPTEKDLENKKTFLEDNSQYPRKVMIS